MSSYQNSRARLEARASAGVAAALNSDVAALAAALEAQSVLATMRSTAEVVNLGQSVTDEVGQVLRTLAPAEWSVAHDRLAAPAESPTAVADSVRAAFDAARTAVGQATRTSVAEEIERFIQLPEQGFAFASTRVGERTTVIEAHRAGSGAGSGEVVMFGIDTSGQVQREYVQHQGVSCEVRDQEWLAHMAGSGFTFDTLDSDVHGGDRDGARMYAPGAARDAADPARGLVLEVESPTRSLFDAPTGPASLAQVRRVGGRA